MTRPAFKTFDAAATLVALKAAAKKRDALIEKSRVKGNFVQVTKPPKLGVSSRTFPGFCFKSSIPVLVDPGSRQWLSEKAAGNSAARILFKKSGDKKNTLVYFIADGDEVNIGSVRTETERDVLKQDPSHLGLVVRMGKGKDSLDCTIRIPQVPAILRSPGQSDQGGLTHQLGRSIK
jgi:hypothetical protein